MTAKKEYWQINTERIADEICAAASEARTEEDLKMRVEPILRKSFKDIGIDIDIVAYEKATALRAKMDVMNHLAIPKFNRDNKIHIKIVELSQKAHNLVAQGKEIGKLQNELDEAVENLWNIKP